MPSSEKTVKKKAINMILGFRNQTICHGLLASVCEKIQILRETKTSKYHTIGNPSQSLKGLGIVHKPFPPKAQCYSQKKKNIFALIK